jgi:hypothetical protein
MKELVRSLHFKLFINLFVCVVLISLTTEANGSHGVIDHGRWLIAIAFLVLCTVYAYLIAEADSKRTIKGTHWAQWIIRTIYVSFIPSILFIQSSNIYNGFLLLFGGCSFYLWFDIVYNKKKGHALNYVGREALTDRVVRWLRLGDIYIPIRAALFIGSIKLLLRYYV